MTIELQKKIDEQIEYYDLYKKNLVQFIMHSCAYHTNSNPHGRVRLNTHEILGLQKEISRMEIFIYDLKLMKNQDSSVFNYIYNKHFN